MMYKRLYFIILFCIPSFVRAQIDSIYKDSLENIEYQLEGLSYNMLNSSDLEERTTSNLYFILTLKKALSIPQSFDYEFNKIKTVSILKSPDNRFRLFTWNVILDSFKYAYYGAGNVVRISMDETTTKEDVLKLYEVFCSVFAWQVQEWRWTEESIPAKLQRKDVILQHPIFNKYHTEHEMLRYIKSLENKDLSLTHSMISLGSCTMKLNATTEMIPVTWPEFSNIHPFVPVEQVEGYMKIFDDLKSWLSILTGFDDCSLQPNSGAQGEYTGLLVIRAYHISRNEKHRNICLVPESAHGTNPASAIMAGMSVEIILCDQDGNIDLQDLKAKAELHSENLSAIMLTYPSTHGIFENEIQDNTRGIYIETPSNPTLKIVDLQGNDISLSKAFIRFLVAIPSILSGLWIIVALIRKDNQCLHDVVSNTQLVLKT